MKKVDIIVIGGGLSGASIALGLVREGAGKVVMFDEQLPTQRLSRGNFGLTWFMPKGANSPVYARWSRMATMLWPEFAAKLEEESGYDIELEWNGGAMHAIGDEQFQAYADSIDTLTKTCSEEGLDYPVRMLDREEFASMIPGMKLGDDVTGAMYSAEQGHVNPLPLLGALRCAFQKKGGEYFGGLSVSKIVPNDDGTVTVLTSQGDYQCDKLVVAAGHGSTRLLADLGEKLHIYPQRGQLIVTERVKKVLHFPILAVRQTMDGTFMIGLSTEDSAYDPKVTVEAMKSQASGAIKLFPELANLNWVRGWGAIRVMTKDGSPIYERLPGHKNIYVIAGHSAVTLAPVKEKHIASWILEKDEAPQISHFSNGRFNV
ncbi:MAG: FAD-binding oxidoreductase [Desulfobulbaceae bacterium]|nr:FAD-binding oxidoreductase [Desulfobulbaceae bacterium]